MVKIAVISDVHGNALALSAVLEDINKRNVERIINLGDTLYGPLQPYKTYLLFKDYLGEIVHVKGNGDRLLLQSSANMTAMRNRDELGDDALKWLAGHQAVYQDEFVFACHASPGGDTVYLLENATAQGPLLKAENEVEIALKGIGQPLILTGHSHIPRLYMLSDGRVIINPGSVGLPAYEDEEPYPHKMETGSPHARYAIIESNDDDVRVEFISACYPYREAAKMAELANRPDWAGALLTGRM